MERACDNSRRLHGRQSEEIVETYGKLIPHSRITKLLRTSQIAALLNKRFCIVLPKSLADRSLKMKARNFITVAFLMNSPSEKQFCGDAVETSRGI